MISAYHGFSNHDFVEPHPEIAEIEISAKQAFEAVQVYLMDTQIILFDLYEDPKLQYVHNPELRLVWHFYCKEDGGLKTKNKKKNKTHRHLLTQYS